MDEARIKVGGIGWVLPTGTGSGPAVLQQTGWRDPTAWPADGLAGFQVKQYLTSAKGYLDAAGAYCLAATVLAMGEGRAALTVPERRERMGVSTISEFGAPVSGYRFYEQFIRKGPRFASPLLFPHGYPNTAGNLVAIEFGLAGPHMVLHAGADAREALDFAVTRLRDGSAGDMLVGAYEAIIPEAVPAAEPVLNGAVMLWLTTEATAPELLALEAGQVAAEPPAGWRDHGATFALLSLLADGRAG